MKLQAKSIKTPAGYFPAPINPAFTNQLESCQTNEDVFKLVEQDGFINPDAFNEVNKRRFYPDYCKWKEQRLKAKGLICQHDYVYKILNDHTAADICTKCGHIKKQ